MNSRRCFVISPIGELESETRRRSDQVLRHIITPAVKECGYEPIRADQISEPGLITRQVIQHIIDSPLVIADLTERNPNVFYELAVRHAIRKPLVQIIQKGEQIPFDVAGTRTIQVDYRDLDSVEKTRSDIVNQIHAIEKDPLSVDSPISMSLDLQFLKRSDDPGERSLVDLVDMVTEIHSTVKRIDGRLGPKDLKMTLFRIKNLSRTCMEQLEKIRHWALKTNDPDEPSIKDKSSQLTKMEEHLKLVESFALELSNKFES